MKLSGQMRSRAALNTVHAALRRTPGCRPGRQIRRRAGIRRDARLDGQLTVFPRIVFWRSVGEVN